MIGRALAAGRLTLESHVDAGVSPELIREAAANARSLAAQGLFRITRDQPADSTGAIDAAARKVEPASESFSAECDVKL
jgi:hypothetical protein